MPTTRKGSTPFITGSDTKADKDRQKAVEKALVKLADFGLSPPRDPRFAFSNTMVRVPAKDGLVRVNLTRTEPSEILLQMFDAIWNAGVEAGRTAERETQAASIMAAFPALRETFEAIVDKKLEAVQERRGYNED